MKRLQVSMPTENASSVHIDGTIGFSRLDGLPPIGTIVKLERDSDEFTIVTIELVDDEAELT